MNKADAVIVLMNDIKATQVTKTSYARVQRALKVLGVEGEDRQRLLFFMAYHNGDGEPYPHVLKAK